MVALAVMVAVAAAAAATLFQQRGRQMAEAVSGEFAFFGLHWAQAQLEEERGKRENW